MHRVHAMRVENSSKFAVNNFSTGGQGSAGQFTALVVALDAVAWKSFELDARTEAESIAQPLDLADTTVDRAAEHVRLAARHHRVLRLYQEPLAAHLTCTGVTCCIPSSSVAVIVVTSPISLNSTEARFPRSILGRVGEDVTRGCYEETASVKFQLYSARRARRKGSSGFPESDLHKTSVVRVAWNVRLSSAG